MLRKLFKHEMKSKSGAMLLLCEILAAATVLLCIIILFDKYVASSLSATIYLISGSIYTLTIIVIFVTSFIYLCVHFYQTMYSSQGYLTHTLPVRTSVILNVKIITALVQLILTIAIILIFTTIAFFIRDSVGIDGFVHVLGEAVKDISENTGIQGSIVVVFLAVMMLLGCLDAVLLFFAGSSIGQLFHRSKGAWGIAAGIALYYISQIASILIIVVVSGSLYAGGVDFKNVTIAYWALSGAIVLLAFWAVVYYIISWVIACKHLNLE